MRFKQQQLDQKALDALDDLESIAHSKCAIWGEYFLFSLLFLAYLLAN
ncbi:hypothetical protein [Bacillus sp. Marseille-P3661]|nr:hypothetical protein [Bacillus sp. Marseille-P3661]